MINRSFIHREIDQDLKLYPQLVITTRFAPEPNGLLHIGHLKTIYANYNLAKQYNGICHLRFDDTNPVSAKKEYYEGICDDIKWLGLKFDHLFYASDYFTALYNDAIRLIQQGKAYICQHKVEEVLEMRGTLTQPGLPSMYRNRSIEENLFLFSEMKEGKIIATLRAKINPLSPNLNLRDPIIYRVKKVAHPRTNDQWSIYPTYDYAHSLSDYYERITHSLCTLEFQDHRPLYNWFLKLLYPNNLFKPKQMEYSRLNIEGFTTSKRILNNLKGDLELSNPLFPTIKGLANRGYTSESLFYFCKQLGLSKQDSIIPLKSFEQTLLQYFNKNVTEYCQLVLEPLLVILDNGKKIYIEKKDFSLEKIREKIFLPNSWINLINFGSIYCTNYDLADDGTISAIYCNFSLGNQGKYYIQFVHENDPNILVKDFTIPNIYHDYKGKIQSHYHKSNLFQAYRIGYIKEMGNQVYHLFLRLKK
jgi:glutaminyl-tRNA synthetase